jgi:Tfp pilus assembly protein PilF
MRFCPRSLLLLLCLLLASISVLETSGVAYAEGKTKAEDTETLRIARQRFQEGVRFFDDGQYAKARAAFLQAYALKQHPSVLLNLAQSELRSGHEAEAAQHFAQFLRETDGSNPGEVRQAQEGLEEARAQVAEVLLTVDVDDAYVLVDGSVFGRSPLPDPVFLAPGTHVLGVRKGGTSVIRKITAAAGEKVTEAISLAAAPSKPAAGRSAATAQEEPEADQPGIGRESFFSWLTSKPGALIGAGVAVIGTATAAVFFISSQTNRAAAEDTRQNILETYRNDPAVSEVDKQNYGPCALQPSDSYVRACSDYVAYNDTADNHQTIAIVSGGVAVAAAAGTIVAYFLDARKGPETAEAFSGGVRMTLLPVAAPGQHSLQLVGQF